MKAADIVRRVDAGALKHQDIHSKSEVNFTSLLLPFVQIFLQIPKGISRCIF